MTASEFGVGLPSLKYSKALGDCKFSSKLSAKMNSYGGRTVEMGEFQRSLPWYVVGTGCLEPGALRLDPHVCDHSHLGRAPGAHKRNIKMTQSCSEGIVRQNALC